MKKPQTFDYQKDEYLKAIGELILEFENVVYLVRTNLGDLLLNNGLTRPDLIDIILGSRVFTADPLFSCYVSVLNQLLRGKGRGKLISDLKRFNKKFQELTEVRNNVVHSTHFLMHTQTIVSETTGEVLPFFRASKINPNSKGYSVVDTGIEKIKLATGELKVLRSNLVKMHKDFLAFTREHTKTME